MTAMLYYPNVSSTYQYQYVPCSCYLLIYLLSCIYPLSFI